MTPDDPAAPDQQIPSPEPLLRMIQGLQVTAILRTGVELGIFDLLAAGPRSAAEVASEVGASERGTRILLDGLTALGLVEGDRDGYGLTPLADSYLVTGRPTYLGGSTRLMAADWAWQGWARLEEAVRGGGSILEAHAEIPEHEFWETFAPSSVGLAQPKSEALAELLSPWAAQRPTLDVLDVACGSGLYSLTLAAWQKHARVTLLDWSNVLALTQENVQRLGLGDRTSVIEGDAFTVPLGGPYDLIVASHIFHHFSEQRCLELLRRLAAVLKPDGRLAIHEFTAQSDRPAEEPVPYLFSVLMLMWTREGEAYPVSTYRRLLETAGFAAPEVHESPGMATRFLIAGRSAAV
jgi:C-methyltransferase